MINGKMKTKTRELKKGLLIVFEGIDGAGKSTQIKLVADLLKSQGYPVVCFQEPTQGKWGQLIRQKAVEAGSLSSAEELELFLRDRQENVELNLLPALRERKIVLLDRYYFSTMAYQGARGLNVDEIKRKNEAFAPRPDLVFILLVEPKLSLQRITSRQRKEILFEEESYLTKVNKLFASFKEENII
ncbi:MAG TPA: dTMP kinase, partial [Candidatus Aminicenantes bacterium]|nr:dTMP kinase [Candidatus Aminicenantes bacterium]